VVLVVALAALFVVVWWKVPPLLYRHSGLGRQSQQ
jgi:hypothetical protein